MFTVDHLFFQTRRHGVRLFLVWYQCLQENASEECHQIFLSLVPGLPDNNQNLLDLMNDSSGAAESKSAYIRHVRFGLRLGQIGTKWDKSWTFKDQFPVHFDS